MQSSFKMERDYTVLYVRVCHTRDQASQSEERRKMQIEDPSISLETINEAKTLSLSALCKL